MSVVTHRSVDAFSSGPAVAAQQVLQLQAYDSDHGCSPVSFLWYVIDSAIQLSLLVIIFFHFTFHLSSILFIPTNLRIQEPHNTDPLEFHGEGQHDELSLAVNTVADII